MESLKELGEPREFWNYFFQITKIPRCSQKEEKIRVFIINEAKKLGYETQTDEIKNLVVRVPSKNQKGSMLKVVLQSHMDMVCEKHERTIHDFAKDPLKLNLIEIDKEKWLTAEGTTLGADNGVGIAYMLAIMKMIHDGNLDFGNLDFDMLFTVDEERGLSGASQMDKKLVSGKYLLNLDSEEDNRFTIGCAGGRVFKADITLQRESLKDPNLEAVEITISGLIGGHSGSDINKRRGNALKILMEIIWKLNSKFNIHLISLEGGNLTNAIPRESHAIFFVDQDKKLELMEFFENITPKIKNLYKGSDSDLSIKLESIDDIPEKKAFSKNFQNKLVDLFHLMPNGPISFHPTSMQTATEHLVHTSLNFAVVHTLDNIIEFKVSTRSLTLYDKETLFEKLKTFFAMSGLEMDLEIITLYPSWPPDFDSELTEISKQVYRELFKEDVIIQAIHAGLECAFFSYYYPGMEMISLGPDVVGGHSPKERLRVKSVEKIWKFLLALLKRLK